MNNYRKANPLVAVYFADSRNAVNYNRAADIFEAHKAIFGLSHVNRFYEVALEYGVPAERLEDCLAALKAAGFKPVTSAAQINRQSRKYLRSAT
jgi:hypothetical protein